MNFKIVFASLILALGLIMMGCDTKQANLSDQGSSDSQSHSQSETPIPLASDSGSVVVPQTQNPIDWAGFRGPGNHSKTEIVFPDKFDSSIVRWKSELIGRGASTPIVIGDKVFLTSYSGYGESLGKPGKIADLQHHVYCFARTDGKLLWQRNIKGSAAENAVLNPNLIGHGFASSTMVSDGNKVFAFFGIGGVFAFDLDGKLLWQQDVGWQSHNFGSSASLALCNDLLIVNASIEAETVFALNKETGHGVWKIDDVIESWTTPVNGDTTAGDRELVIPQKNVVRGFDPETGAELWTCEGILDYIVPTALTGDGIVYCNGGKENRTLAIRLGGRGDVTKSHKLWEAEVGANVTSSVIGGEHIYQISDRGILQVLDRTTGEVVKRERLKGAGTVFASPLLCRDKLFFPLLHGIAVVNADPNISLVSHNKITDDEAEFRASLCVYGDQMFTRNDNWLYCLGPGQQDTRTVKLGANSQGEFEQIVSTPKYDFEQATGRIRFYNRCLVKTKHDLRVVMLTPYKSVITEKQTAHSIELLNAEFPKFAEMRLERRKIVWDRMTGEASEEEFVEQISALDKKVIQTQAAIRKPIKAMFSKEQMDQHMAEHRAWLEKNKKKNEEKKNGKK